MVTTLYLIRHGETEGADVKRYKGSIDVPLSDNGIIQIQKTADFVFRYLKLSEAAKKKSYLNDIHNPHVNSSEEPALSSVYCSDLGRAIKSAEIVAEPYGLSPVANPAFRERNFGVWEGMSFPEIKEKYPSEFEAWASDPVTFSPVGGESTADMNDRVMPALDMILEKHQGESIALVAHGGVNRIILCNIMGVPLENVFRVEQDFAAVNVIEFWDKYPVVKLVNGVFH
ncbi:MAG: histidine phosphatase family protein [Nitrospirae bacterium]|nr:MAG: histidine phosphatase family protein [Nitrospirota bacterium]